MAEITTQPLPAAVTRDNWVKLQAEGWEHLTNIGWPVNEFDESDDTLVAIMGKYSRVKTGWPMGETGPTDDLNCMAGVYIRKT